MEDKSGIERVIIFIDGSNLYHLVKKLVPEKKPNDFDFEKFTKYLLRDRKLVRIYYYNCPLDRRKDEKAYIKQQRFFDKIQRIPNFSFVLCRMQKKKSNNKIIYEAKEDDIHLAVDMVKLSYNDAYDTAILVSSDGDFVPAVQAVKEKGKNVENIGFENKFSYHLQQTCDKFSKLKRTEVEKFFS
ncbi:NYN domain-containing protein [Candidatus Pacearchaeota archaeon CG_4_10_14_0_2_um_filter_35_33]|nr:MAG: NYN domain-containing protein [Candidatus Pacearchaeota archaeon CG_4_10_14_0_8_um_filter_35_169]PIZ79538.1 MAG: NYN domain-containing protein [Candidatus Pacearchaeota archaeon CG_4_10_14_0_2_um_filter_35_33]PJB93993.1 MAG: NYN domain-containing protein [Candidatus Pacearchaeota archaeon CG_4_9_14_0_8_um_filter_35_24]